MNLKPLHDNVIIKAGNLDEITKSGIVLPETMTKEKSEQGEIVAVGSGKILDNGSKKEMSVKVGDHVMFKKYSSDEIEIDGEEYLIVKEEDILAIV